MDLPPIVFGTSSLGNIYKELDYETKLNIVKAFFDTPKRPVVIDTAGKYGAGLSLECLGKCLEELDIPAEDVIISNKLGWKRVPLKGEEPTFEKGVWFGLQHDAVQTISYDGIMDCYHQGNKLLGKYSSQFVSVHDPDEYLVAALSLEDRVSRMRDIKEAYRALSELKAKGSVTAIGVGAKDWKVIQELVVDEGIVLDWVMFANSFTLYQSPPKLLELMKYLWTKNVTIINSAVFHGGFLTGGDFYDYQEVSRRTHPDLYSWRDSLFRICKEEEVDPALVCTQWALLPKMISSLALNSSRPERVRTNINLVMDQVAPHIWARLVQEGLISHGHLSDLLVTTG